MYVYAITGDLAYKSFMVSVFLMCRGLQRNWLLMNAILTHNHRLGKEIIGHYPSSRRLSSEEKKKVAEILSLRPNHKHLKAMIKKNYD